MPVVLCTYLLTNNTAKGPGFIMTTVAWAVDAVVVFALLAVGFFKLAKEDDYQRIPD